MNNKIKEHFQNSRFYKNYNNIDHVILKFKRINNEYESSKLKYKKFLEKYIFPLKNKYNTKSIENLSKYEMKSYKKILNEKLKINHSIKKYAIENPISLNTVVFNDNGNDIFLEDVLPSNFNLEKNIELNKAIDYFMKFDVTKYLLLGYTQEEISKILGCSQPQVSRLIKKYKENYMKENEVKLWKKIRK